MNEQVSEVIETLIAVKGRDYYDCVVFGVTIHTICTVFRQCKVPQGIHDGVVESLGEMWRHATQNNGFDTSSTDFGKTLLADVISVVKAAHK